MGSMTGATHDVAPSCPAFRTDLSTYPLDDELVIYDPESGESFVLNASGKYVWERCDGKRTDADIAAEIAAIYAIPAAQAIADVAELLDSFRRANLLLAGPA